MCVCVRMCMCVYLSVCTDKRSNSVYLFTKFTTITDAHFHAFCFLCLCKFPFEKDFVLRYSQSLAYYCNLLPFLQIDKLFDEFLNAFINFLGNPGRKAVTGC